MTTRDPRRRVPIRITSTRTGERARRRRTGPQWRGLFLLLALVTIAVAALLTLFGCALERAGEVTGRRHSIHVESGSTRDSFEIQVTGSGWIVVPEEHWRSCTPRQGAQHGETYPDCAR